MGRPVSSDLQALLDLPDVETQTTLDLQLTDEEATLFHFATDELSVGALIYTADLRQTSELKQSMLTPPDRVNTTVENVDKQIGAYIFNEAMTKGVAIVGRLYTDRKGDLPSAWVELFRGEPRPTSLNESEATIEVLHDLAAAGYCVADWSLAPNCQFVFKQSDTCGYAGVETLCNHRRNSPGGCFGRDNEHHYGGMEANEAAAPTIPNGGGDPGGDPFPTCPRVDQWILVRGMDGQVVPKLVADLSSRDWCFNPVTETFHQVASAAIVKDQPIVRLVADNMGACFSSPTHRIIRDRHDNAGTPVEVLHEGQSLLVFKKRLEESSVVSVTEERATGDVCEIELEDGHIYCAGHTPKAFIVAHNVKPIP